MERYDDKDKIDISTSEEMLIIFNEKEKQFIQTLQDRLMEVGLDDRLHFNILSDKTVNFTIDGMQIGRVKLSGRKFRMQILNDKTVSWLDIKDVSEAIAYIDHWVKYAKRLIKR